MKIRKQLYIATLLLLGACGTAKVATTTASMGQADADRGAREFKGLTVNDLSRGKMLYEEKCTTCHGLKNPGSFSETEWKELVPSMAKKANKRSEVIDANSQDLILKYVVTMGPLNKTK